MFRILFFILISISAKGQTVYKTPSGSKYHLATCRMVNNVSKQITISDALNSGLLPCKICRPPSSISSNFLPEKRPKGENSTVQCKGMTKAGTRCKHRTSIANGYCFQHNPDKNL